MLLNKIIINDLGVYRGRNEFNFKTNSEKPIILCGGTNGAGKTTLFESVLLCLYGQHASEEKISEKKYHENIARKIHRYLGTKKAAEEASVIIEFEFSHEGKIYEYQVIRMWQNNEGIINEILTIKKKNPQDENFNQLDSIEESEWQLFIEQLIPKGVVKLFFFDGEKIQNLAQDGGEDGYIKSSFDALLGLDLVNQLRDDIGLTLLRNSNGDTKKILAEIDLLNKEKKETEEKIKKYQEKQAEYKAKIDFIQKKIFATEEKFGKLGGGFAKKREELTIEKVKFESKIEKIEKEIRDLCTDTLPFSLIPKELEEVKSIMKSDQQKIQNNFEKDILEKNFKELLDVIHSESFLSTVSDDVKQNVRKQIDDMLKNKLESVPDVTKLTFSLSINNMNHIIKLIDKINNTSEQKIEDLTNSFNIIFNSLEKINVGLQSAPKEDEIGPIFSKLSEYSREFGELDNELNNLKSLEAQERSLLMLQNGKIRRNLTEKYEDKKRMAGLEIGSKVQVALDNYSNLLRSKKLELLENYILDKLQTLLHKKDFIEKISIDRETFEVKLYKGNDDEITKDMLSKGELQMYATAIVWGLALTSGRPLPFMIDTPLARLDNEHRESMVKEFFPYASHQTIILSTDSEINYEYYKKLKPNIGKEFVIQYDSEYGGTKRHDSYFFGEEGEKIIEV